MSKRNIPGVQDTDEQARLLAVMSSNTTLHRCNLAMVRPCLGWVFVLRQWWSCGRRSAELGSPLVKFFGNFEYRGMVWLSLIR